MKYVSPTKNLFQTSFDVKDLYCAEKVSGADIWEDPTIVSIEASSFFLKLTGILCLD